jgi:hypothetical protein
MLGASQERWIADGLGSSSARWRVLANPVMIAPYDNLAGDQERVSMDQWSGYPAARSRLLESIAQRAPNRTVVLTGDIHTNWVNELRTDFRRVERPSIAAEFVGTSISSGGDGNDETVLSTPEIRAERMKQSRSILDSLVSELETLRRQLGAGDVRTVNQYTDEIREIERRIQLAAKHSNEVPDLDLPPGIPEQFDEHVRLHSKMLAVAFKADITRVATLLGARDLTSRVYQFPKSPLFPEGGTSVSFHGGSHHQDDPVQIRRYAALNRYHVSTMAYLAEELKGIKDGDGTLLDRTLIMYGTNMGNSNQHQHYDVPHILVGGANGKLKGNRHLKYDRKTMPTGNLLLSVLDMFDIHQEKQGDSTGRLPRLV